jgi:hypothetical protein
LKTSFYQTERQKKIEYTAAIAEAEDASEREAALALKRDVVSTYLAWGSDGFLKNRSEMMRTINCNRVTPNPWEYRLKWFFGECQTAKLGGTPAKDHE